MVKFFKVYVLIVRFGSAQRTVEGLVYNNLFKMKSQLSTLSEAEAYGASFIYNDLFKILSGK
ncbi:hypothetical protein [Chryseobacterium gambrini]|uniref:hypothetical protein n=1 Tax=Chryseobacterium gambrini TaxID=373672 RepID=UPI003BA6B820